MIRQTSIDAYNTIKQNGSLSRRRWEIYDVIFNNGPLTAGEIGQNMSEYRSSTSTADRNIHARLAELRNMDIIYEVRERECSVTNKRVIEWDVTNSLPKKLDRKKTKNQIIKELQEEIKQLKSQIEDLEWK